MLMFSPSSAIDFHDTLLNIFFLFGFGRFFL